MPHNLTIDSIIDKNKVSSSNVFLILLEVEVRDTEGVLVDMVRIAKNSEDVVFETNTFTASNFELDIQIDALKEPSITLEAHDETKQLAQYVDAYDGLVGCNVRVIIVNSGGLTGPADIDEQMIVLSSSFSAYKLRFELGVESSVGLRFPNFRQFKDICFKKFKGPRCQYAGPDATCSYSRTGTNGCIAKNNEINFGGFTGINELF